MRKILKDLTKSIQTEGMETAKGFKWRMYSRSSTVVRISKVSGWKKMEELRRRGQITKGLRDHSKDLV